MKKTLISALFLVSSGTAIAQVGINSSTPTTTLDVTAKNATGTATNVDGLLIPRVDRQRALGMTGVPTSTLIYINSIATGTQTGTAVNIDAIGYYFYNGTAWTKLGSNMYTTDGTLTGNRIVTQGANTLAFTGTTANAFSVDGTTLSVDAANNRVGVGTASPAAMLEVGNKTTAVNPNIRLQANGNSYGTGGILEFREQDSAYGMNVRHETSDTPGILEGLHFNVLFNSVEDKTNPVLSVIQTTRKVGIGVAAPLSQLSVNGDLQLMKDLKVGGSPTVAGSAGTAGQILISGGAGAAPAWSTPSAISIPAPAVFVAQTPINDFLSTQGNGGKDVSPMAQIKNAIPGLTYDSTTSTVTFPSGTYQITYTYEALHNSAGCTISSYFEDFPTAAGTIRVHSTAAHNVGGLSYHGGNISYTSVALPAGKTWQLHLGRGASGNCLGAGMVLQAQATHVVIYRLGD